MAKEGEERLFTFPAEFATLIAHAANDWSTLEHQANDLIWRCAGVSAPLGACITAQIFTLDGRLRALLSLMKLRELDERLIKRVNKFVERARQAQEFRNRIIHDMWVADLDDAGEVRRFGQQVLTARSKLDFDIREISTQDLEKQCKTIFAVQGEFNNLRYEIVAALAASPQMPHEDTYPRFAADPAQRRTRPNVKQ